MSLSIYPKWFYRVFNERLDINVQSARNKELHVLYRIIIPNNCEEKIIIWCKSSMVSWSLTVSVSDCFLIVFCRSMLFLLATSRDSSSSVMWICNFFFTRWTSVFSFVSASTTRAFSCSISMLVCLLIYFDSYEHTDIQFVLKGIQPDYCFQVINSKTFWVSKKVPFHFSSSNHRNCKGTLPWWDIQGQICLDILFTNMYYFLSKRIFPISI